MTPNRDSLARLLRQHGAELTPDQVDRLWQYHQRLRSANAELNLTRIHNFENMVIKHYVDSLSVLRYVELPSPLVDMGSGAGLPGIPLAIARSDPRFILAEPRGPRVRFLNQTVRELGLRNVEIYEGKVGRRFDTRVGGFITRAVASIGETLECVVRCLAPGGRVIMMKGPMCDQEIEEAAQQHAGAFRLVADHKFVIPGTPHQRRIVEYVRLDRDLERTPQIGAEGRDRLPDRDLTSETNSLFQELADLLSGRGVRKHRRALMAGRKVVAELLVHHGERVEAWLTGPEGPPPPSRPGSSINWFRLSGTLFRKIDVSGTHAPIALVRVPELSEWRDDAPWPMGCSLFVSFQDPENVGAVLRSAAAFGVARVVLLKGAAHPFHPKSARAAGPALFHLLMESGPSLNDLRVEHARLVALAADGQPIESFTWPERFGMVAGIEGPGLPDRFATGDRVHIPIANTVESLNAATAVAIALHEWREKCVD